MTKDTIERRYYRIKEVVIKSGLSYGMVRRRCERLGIPHLNIPKEKYDQLVSMELSKEKKTYRLIVHLTPQQNRSLRDFGLKHGVTKQEALRIKAFGL